MIRSIDLHNHTSPRDALDELEISLFRFYKTKQSPIHIIHGIGTGALASAVHEALTKNPLITSFECEGGGCLVNVSTVSLKIHS